MSALQEIRDVIAGLRNLRIEMTEVVADHEDDDRAVTVLRGLVHLESILTGALRELQTPEDPRPVQPAKASEEPAQSEDEAADGHLVLSPLEVADIREHLETISDTTNELLIGVKSEAVNTLDCLAALAIAVECIDGVLGSHTP